MPQRNKTDRRIVDGVCFKLPPGTVPHQKKVVVDRCRQCIRVVGPGRHSLLDQRRYRAEAQSTMTFQPPDPETRPDRTGQHPAVFRSIVGR